MFVALRLLEQTLSAKCNIDITDSGVINALVEQSKADLKFYQVKMDADKDDLRDIMVKLRDRDISTFLLIISSRRSRLLLKQARKIGVIARPFSWLALNLVLPTFLFNFLYTDQSCFSHRAVFT